MSGLIATIDYSDESNFSKSDSAKFNWPGTKIELALVGLSGQELNQDFNSDVDFTYDSANAEFVGGLLRQKDQRPLNSTSWATYTDNIDLNYGGGVLAGTSIGTAAVIGNKLACLGGSANYVSYNSNLNTDSQQITTVKFIYIPDYTGVPSAIRGMFVICEGHNLTDNSITMYHSGTSLHWIVVDSTGALVLDLTNLFSPVAGTEYEIEFNIDLTNGNTRGFIDGVLVVSDLTSTAIRSADIGLLRVGSNTGGTWHADAWFKDFIVFDTVQHTANYVAGYTLEESRYLGSKVDGPDFIHAGAGTIVSVDDGSTIEVGLPRYIIGSKWWDGTAWSISDGSYTQANPFATALANFGSFSMAGSILTWSIVFADSLTISTVDQFNIEYTGQIYSTTNPWAMVSAANGMTNLLAMTETNLITTNDDKIKFALYYDGVDHYIVDSVIVVSNGTYEQTNTLAEWSAILPCDIVPDAAVKLKIFLHSESGNTTPSVEQILLEYNLYIEQIETSTCRVYGTIQDGINNVDGAVITVKSVIPFFSDDNSISINESKISSESGYYMIVLPETTSAGIRLDVLETFIDAQGIKQNNHFKIIVPVQISISMEDAKALAAAG